MRGHFWELSDELTEFYLYMDIVANNKTEENTFRRFRFLFNSKNACV